MNLMEWIEVEKKLPPDGVDVLMFLQNHEMFVSQYSASFPYIEIDGKEVYPTHWMPLPRSPMEF